MTETEEPDNYDPFAERHVKHPTTDCETLLHMLKSSMGSGILGMSIAFKYSGLFLGIVCTILTAVIATHCCYILVMSAHRLYKKTHHSQMTFDQVAEAAFQNGPKWCQHLAPGVKYFARYGILMTCFAACSSYNVIIAATFQKILSYYGHTFELRVLICILSIPMVLICWIPDLKYLSPISLITNICMLVALCVTGWYLSFNLPSITERKYANFATLPRFFTICMFAMGVTGVIMPLENNMKTPRHVLGRCGVIVRGMVVGTIIYMSIGFFGYLRYGEKTAESITLNLPIEQFGAQCVEILIALSIYGTYGLQMYVCFDIIFNAFDVERCLTNYAIRTLLVILSILMAILVPAIAPFMELIGALCFSTLLIILPALIQMVTFYNIGYGRFKYILWKDVFVVFCGLLSLFFGTTYAMKSIIALYQ